MPRGLKEFWREIQTFKNEKMKSHLNSTNCNTIVINHSELDFLAFALSLH